MRKKRNDTFYKGVIFTGLDYTISLRVKNHKEDTIREIELAYWRKCYGIRDCLHSLVEDLGKRVGDDDYEAVCSTRHFSKIIEVLCKELTNLDSDLWTDSIWSGETIRNMTYDNLKVLTQMQSIFSSPLPLQREDKFMDMVEDSSLSDNIIEDMALIDWEHSTFEIVSYNSY